MLKREKRKGMYYWIIRDEKGRYITSKKYSRTLSKERVWRQFKSTGSLNDNIKIERSNLTYVTELSITRKDNKLSTRYLNPKRKGVAQVSVSVLINKQIMHARSNRIGSTLAKDIRSAKQDALNNLYERVSGKFLDSTDADEGRALIEKNKAPIKFSVIYYKRK